MIAKLIPLRSRASSFGQLARYVVDARGRPDPATWTRTADYILDTKQGGAKVSGVRVTNCLNDDPAAATLEILNHQDKNSRSGTDKTLHLVVSFPVGERPTQGQLHTIEDRLCAAIGLAEHPRLSAVHTDTDHLHVHIAINKVHPRTRRNVTPYYPKFRLMDTCEHLEVELGLVRIFHGVKSSSGVDPDLQGRKPLPAADMEAHAGRDSFYRWVKEAGASRVREAAQAASSWHELHLALAADDLQIRPRGAGLVIVARRSNVAIKASDVDRSLSLQALTKRFGAFEAAGAAARKVTPERHYTGAPLDSGPEAGRLFAMFQFERARAIDARRDTRTLLRDAHRAYVDELNTWYADRRQALKARCEIRGPEKRAAYMALHAQRSDDLCRRAALERAQLHRLNTRSPLPTWQKFLRRAAEAGDPEAIAALRHRQRRPSPPRVPCMGAANDTPGHPIVLKDLRPQVLKNGDITYKTADGALVVDTQTKIHLDQVTDEAISIALALAEERFQGQRLKINGSAAFKLALVRAAVEGKRAVTFDDAGMEAARVAASVRAEAESPPKADAPSPIERYVGERNAFHSIKSDISYIHRLWIQSDAGSAEYQGRRCLEDGSEVVLPRRGDTMLVKLSSSAQVAKASQWKIGQIVETDARGRFVDSGRGKGR